MQIQNNKALNVTVELVAIYPLPMIYDQRFIHLNTNWNNFDKSSRYDVNANCLQINSLILAACEHKVMLFVFCHTASVCPHKLHTFWVRSGWSRYSQIYAITFRVHNMSVLPACRQHVNIPKNICACLFSLGLELIDPEME